MTLQQLRSDPQTWHILEERARALTARKVEVSAEQGEELVAFRLGDESYALPARAVREIIPLGAYTPLPWTPPFLLGLVNLRGRLLAAFDLRPLLDLPPAPPQASALLIIISVPGVEAALLADHVDEVRRSDDLVAAQAANAAQPASWVRGVDRHLHLVLDPAGLLADQRLQIGSAGTAT